jgi:hypothetical protein
MRRWERAYHQLVNSIQSIDSLRRGDGSNRVWLPHVPVLESAMRFSFFMTRMFQNPSDNHLDHFIPPSRYTDSLTLAAWHV